MSKKEALKVVDDISKVFDKYLTETNKIMKKAKQTK